MLGVLVRVVDVRLVVLVRVRTPKVSPVWDQKVPTWVSSSRSGDTDDEAPPSAELLEVMSDLSGLPSSAISVAAVADVDFGHVRLVAVVVVGLVALRPPPCELQVRPPHSN